MAALACAVAASGCGASAPPTEHAPPTAEQDDAGNDAQAGPDTQETDTPAPAFPVTHPFTDIGPKCKKSFSKLSHASLPIFTSQEQLDKFLGCKTTMVVDWSSESIVPVTFKGINRAWSFKGLSTDGGVTTITVLTDTLNRGAAMHTEAFWLVRVPPSTKSVVIHTTSPPQKPDGALYP